MPLVTYQPSAPVDFVHSEPSADVILRFTELVTQARSGSMLTLMVSMPCCVTTNGRCCGRGATNAIVTPQRDAVWLLHPICEACARTITTIHCPPM